jgi:hypothetical protein
MTITLINAERNLFLFSTLFQPIEQCLIFLFFYYFPQAPNDTKVSSTITGIIKNSVHAAFVF